MSKPTCPRGMDGEYARWLTEAERPYLSMVMSECGSINRASRRLGLTSMTLRKKLKRCGIYPIGAALTQVVREHAKGDE
jgi:DNA-binding NtrC family response regulator